MKLCLHVDTFDARENILVLECKVSGNPTPEIFWQKDDKPLPICGSKYRTIQIFNDTWQLIIKEPESGDSGIYTCFASNDYGKMNVCKLIEMTDYEMEIRERERLLLEGSVGKDVISEAEVSKRETESHAKSMQALKSKLAESNFRLQLETAMKPLTVPSGIKAQLICYVSGLIEDVYWLRGGERVVKDARHKIYSINGALSLEIYEANPEDSGDYKCIVRNSRNSLESSCSLQVYDSLLGDNLPPNFVNNITGKECFR